MEPEEKSTKMDSKETDSLTKELSKPTEIFAEEVSGATETHAEVSQSSDRLAKVSDSPKHETHPNASSVPESSESKTPKSLKAKPNIMKKSAAANGTNNNVKNKGNALQRNKRKNNNKGVSQGSKFDIIEEAAKKPIASKENQSDQAEKGETKVDESVENQPKLDLGEKSGSEKESQHEKIVNEEHTEKSPEKEKTSEPPVKKRRRPRKGKKPSGPDNGLKDGENKEIVAERKKSFRSKKKSDKTDGLIFMCSGKTKPDCFRYRVMGVSLGKKDTVMSVKRGMKLFLYDFDLKLLYGVFKATATGGVKLEPEAFGGAFPAQVRFEVHKDCIPLPEAVFKKAIKENYNEKNKFKTELTALQVKKLMSLFKPAEAIPLPKAAIEDKGTTHRVEDGKVEYKGVESQDKESKKVARESHSRSARKGESRSGWDEKARDGRRNGDSRSRHPLSRERDRGHRDSRREASPRNLYLTEKEYRTYGLRGERRNLTPPPRIPDPLPSDTYRRDYERDHRLLRHPETLPRDTVLEPRETRLVDPLYRSERDYHHPCSLGAGRELTSLAPSANPLDSYENDPYYARYYAPVPAPPSVSSYLAPPRREDIHLGPSSYLSGGRRESYLLDTDSLRREDIDSLRRREEANALHRREESRREEGDALRRREREIDHLDRLYSSYSSSLSGHRGYHSSRQEAASLPASSRYLVARSYPYR